MPYNRSSLSNVATNYKNEVHREPFSITRTYRYSINNYVTHTYVPIASGNGLPRRNSKAFDKSEVGIHDSNN